MRKTRIGKALFAGVVSLTIVLSYTITALAEENITDLALTPALEATETFSAAEASLLNNLEQSRTLETEGLDIVYLNPNIDDYTGDGTEKNPVNTFASALNHVRNGGTIVVTEEGTFSVAGSSITKAVTIQKGEGVVGDVSIQHTFAIDASLTEGTLKFVGLTFSDGPLGDYQRKTQSKLNIQFENCVFNDASGNCVYIERPIDSLTITGCTFNGKADSYQGQYLVWPYAVKTITIKSNQFNGKGTIRGAIHLGEGASGGTTATIEENTFSGFERVVQLAFTNAAPNTVTVSNNKIDNIKHLNKSDKGEQEYGILFLHKNLFNAGSIRLSDNTIGENCQHLVYSENNTPIGLFNITLNGKEYAPDPVNNSERFYTPMVASVGSGDNEKWYASLIGDEGAVAKANSGDTITLLRDVTANVTIPQDKTVTLNLGSHTITNDTTASDTFKDTISNRGTLVLNGTGGKIDNVTSGCGALVNYPGGTVTVNSGVTLCRSAEAEGNSWYTIKNMGTMIIDGATVTSGEHGINKSSLIDNGWYDGATTEQQAGDRNTPHGSGTNEATLTINNGTFSKGMNTVKNDDWGNLVIENGTFTNTSDPLVLNWNKATINGGNFTATSGYVLANGTFKETSDLGQMTITGGTFTSGNNGQDPLFGYGIGGKQGDYLKIIGGSFTGKMPEVILPYTLSISGGTFSSDVTKYCVSGKYAQLDDNKYVIVDIPKNVPGNSSVGDKSQNIETKPAVSDDIKEADKTVATQVAESITNNPPASGTDDENNATLSNNGTVGSDVMQSEKNDAITKLKANGYIKVDESGTISAGSSLTPQGSTTIQVKVLRETYLDVEALEASKDNKEITLEITPKYNAYAVVTTETETELAKVPLDSGRDLDVAKGNKIYLRIGIPENFANEGETVFVLHDSAYGLIEHKLIVQKDTNTSGLYVEFYNEYGFSKFTLKSPAAKIEGTEYATLQSAVNSVANEGTITLQKDNSEQVTVTRTVKFTLNLDNKTFSGSITPGSYTTGGQQADGTYAFVYAPPVTPTTPNSGVAAGADGKLHVYKDGKVDTGATGLYADAEGKETYYFVKGDLAQDGKYTGLVTDTNGKVASVKDSKVDTTLNGLICIDKGDHRLFENGWTDPTSAYKGLYKNTDGNYYYLEKSAVDFGYNGLVLDEKDNFRLVQDGVCYAASTYKGLAKHVDGWYYYIQDGKLNEQFNGLVTDENGDFRLVQNGVCNTTSPYEGLAKHSDGWFYYLKAGKIDMTYTGLVPDGDLNFWYVYKGCVNTTSTEAYAVQHSDGQWYAIQGGKWDKTFTGTLKDWNGAEHSFTGGTAA